MRVYAEEQQAAADAAAALGRHSAALGRHGAAPGGHGAAAPREHGLWICKPAELSRGRKIFLLRELGEEEASIFLIKKAESLSCAVGVFFLRNLA